MCVCKIVTLSALCVKRVGNSPRQRVPLYPPPVLLHTVRLIPTKGGITVPQLPWRGGGNPRYNGATINPPAPQPTSSFWTQTARMGASDAWWVGRISLNSKHLHITSTITSAASILCCILQEMKKLYSNTFTQSSYVADVPKFIFSLLR